MRETNIKSQRRAGRGPNRASLWIAVALLLTVPAARGQQDRNNREWTRGTTTSSSRLNSADDSFPSSAETHRPTTHSLICSRGRGCWDSQRRFVRWTITTRFSTVCIFSNFGYGGDPNDVSRLRISKNRWYDFDALFRKDENFWDYSLLANPLNPVTPAFANAPAGFTPVISEFAAPDEHPAQTGRLQPDAAAAIKNSFSGWDIRTTSTMDRSFTTIHQGTEQLLLQDWKTTTNTYRLGVDFRLLPRTNISYDQIWNYYKGDSGTTDQNQIFALSNGQLVDLGVSFNAGANQPCATTFRRPAA